jgi:exopolysaccharide biosynthesis polyprenyl glycosylphosphotransferase
MPAAAHGRPIPAPRLVASADVALMMSALVLAFAGRSGSGWIAGALQFLTARIHVYDTALLVGFGAAVFLIFDRAGLYDASRLRRWSEEAVRVVVATSVLTVLGVALIASSHPGRADGTTLLRFWIGGVVALAAARSVRSRVARSLAGCRRVLIVGSGPHARRIFHDLSVDPLTRYQVLGFVDTSDRPRSPFMTRRTLGTFDALESILVREHVDEVHVGLPVKSHYREMQNTIRVCERIGVKVTYGAHIFGTELARPHVDRAGAPRVELQVVTEGWTIAAKRALDLAGGTLALLVLSPLMIATAIAIRMTSEGPVIFAQERYGLNRRRFRMLKFRTMVPNAEQLQAPLESLNEANGPVFKIANDPRITPLGRWLRRASIDELPQLFNVLAGDMSLVGPRPLPIRDVVQFTRSADLRRFSVRPGITGLWQVSGRSRLGFDQWITLDLHYIDHWSLGMDAAILARTIPAVLRGTGAA